MDTPQEQSPKAPSAPKATPTPKAIPANWQELLKAKEVLPDKAAEGAAAEPLDLSPLAPDYRFRTAAAAAFEGRLLSRRRHDRLTCDLADYLAARSECHDESERLAVDRSFEDIALAVRAHSGSDREIGFAMAAYTLARLGASDIGRRLKLGSPVAERYQKYFFDYGALLDNPTYVVGHAGIEQALRSSDAMLQRKGVLLLVGYFCGWRALDQLAWTPRAHTGGHVWSNLPTTLEQIHLFDLLGTAVQAAFSRHEPPRTASDYAALAAVLGPLIDRNGLSNTPTQNLLSLPPMP